MKFPDIRHFHPESSATASEVIDLAWFDDPHRPVRVLVWDEETKRKMRQPVLGNGYHHLSDESLRMLVALV